MTKPCMFQMCTSRHRMTGLITSTNRMDILASITSSYQHSSHFYSRKALIDFFTLSVLAKRPNTPLIDICSVVICLYDKSANYQNFSVLYCLPQSEANTRAVFTGVLGLAVLGLGLVFFLYGMCFLNYCQFFCLMV